MAVKMRLKEKPTVSIVRKRAKRRPLPAALVIPKGLTADEQAQIADILATAKRQIDEIIEASGKSS
jgi:hypothetical protein